MPNGKLQREEILKADYQKNLEDARALSKLADELKTDLEKNDYNVLSVGSLKKTDDIDRLAGTHPRPAQTVLTRPEWRFGYVTLSQSRDLSLIRLLRHTPCLPHVKKHS